MRQRVDSHFLFFSLKMLLPKNQYLLETSEECLQLYLSIISARVKHIYWHKALRILILRLILFSRLMPTEISDLKHATRGPRWLYFESFAACSILLGDGPKRGAKCAVWTQKSVSLHAAKKALKSRDLPPLPLKSIFTTSHIKKLSLVPPTEEGFERLLGKPAIKLHQFYCLFCYLTLCLLEK